MFELESGDILVKTSIREWQSKERSFVLKDIIEYTVRVLTSGDKKFYELAHPKLRQIFDEKGLLILEDNFYIANTEGHHRIYYVSPDEYKWTYTSITSFAGSRTKRKIFIEVSGDHMEAYKHVSIKSDKGIMEEISRASGSPYGTLWILHAPGIVKRYSNVSVYYSDFEKLLPFEEGKSFAIKKPISSEGRSEKAGMSVYDTVSGDFHLTIKLGKKIPYQISEDITISAYEFTYESFEHKRNIHRGHAKDGGKFETFSISRSECKATGKVAFVGFPLIVECDEIHTVVSEEIYNISITPDGRVQQIPPLPTNSFKDHIKYTVKVKKAKKKMAPEECDIEKIIPPISDIEKAMVNKIKSKVKIEEIEVKLPKEIATKVTKPEVERVPKKPKREVEVRIKKKVIAKPKKPKPPKPKKVKKKVRKLKEVASKATKLKPPKLAAPEEIVKPIEIDEPTRMTIRTLQDKLMRTIKTKEDLVKMYETNKNALQVNPVLRVAFLSFLKSMLKIDHEMIDKELSTPLKELVDEPIDYVEDILKESGLSEQIQRVQEELDRTDLEKQRQHDIERITKELARVAREYMKELLLHKEAWEMLTERIEKLLLGTIPGMEEIDYSFMMDLYQAIEESWESFIELLVERVLGNVSETFSTFMMVLGFVQDIALGAKLLTSASRLLMLHNRITELKNKLELVKAGLLINPEL